MNEREFRVLRALVINLRTISQEIHAIHEDQQAADTDKEAQPVRPLTVEIEADPRIPVAICEHYEAENRYRKSKWRKFKTLAEMVGIGSAFALAILTYLTLQQIISQTQSIRTSATAAINASRTAQQALALARDNFRQDQRPYVALTESRDPQAPKAPFTFVDDGRGKRIGWTWFYTNYGRSPAYNLRFSQEMEIEGKIIGPSTSSVGFAVPTGKLAFSTAVSLPGIEDAEFSRLMKTDGAILIRGRLFYTDAYGGSYETGFCLRYLATGATEYCDGNYIK